MQKNWFPMPTAKNGQQILNLHPKKHIIASTRANMRRPEVIF